MKMVDAEFVLIDDPEKDEKLYQQTYMAVIVGLEAQDVYDTPDLVFGDDAHGDWSEFLVGMGVKRANLQDREYLKRSLQLWKDADEPGGIEAFYAGKLHRK
jgi:hypothetical protein